MRGGPALVAGLRADDVLLAIDGNALVDESIDEIASRLMGPVGSCVGVEVLRDGARLGLQLTRASIVFETVRGARRGVDGKWVQRLDGSEVAYLRVSGFSSSTIDDVDAALGRVELEGARAQVLDLRDNIGGLSRAAIEVADRFLDGGTIVTFRERVDGAEVAEVREAIPGAVALPMIVLVSPSTISAGEILAAALQDNGRARIMGARTFGKGTSQRVIALDGDLGAVKLTVATQDRPSGVPLDRHGSGGDAQRGGVWPDSGLEVAAAQTQWRTWGDELADLDLRAWMLGDDAAVRLDADPTLAHAVVLLADGWMRR